MNYIGSKHRLTGFLEHEILRICGSRPRDFADLFAGTGTVGRHFKQLGSRVCANDLLYFAFVLNRHYIGNTREPRFRTLARCHPALRRLDPDARRQAVCALLDSLPPLEGFCYRHYCLGGSASGRTPRQYFSDENGLKCDAIRTRIEQWRLAGDITEDEYFFLLASLLESIDAAANTASVYGAFLKKLKPMARPLFHLRPAAFVPGRRGQQVHHGDANTLVRTISGTILYIDPPYNNRQYAANYHVLETIARYDEPDLRGLTGLRHDYPACKSLYSSIHMKKVGKVVRDLIDHARFRYIFFSYNNEGFLQEEFIRKLLETKGSYGIRKKRYKRFKADSDTNRVYRSQVVEEHLHYCVCS